MSFIMSRQKCGDCGDEWNIATGTFGYGSPDKCPKCGSKNIEFGGFGWKMEDGSTYPKPYDKDDNTKNIQI